MLTDRFRKRLAVGVAASVLWLVAAPASADDTWTARLGADGAMVVPFGGWKDTGAGFGGLAGGWLRLQEDLAATLRAGILHHAQRGQTIGDGVSGYTSLTYRTREVPVLAGVEWLLQGRRGFFLTGELGYVNVLERTEHDGASSTDTYHRVGLTLGGGYRVGDFHARAQLFMPHVADPVKQKGVLFGVGYRFLAL